MTQAHWSKIKKARQRLVLCRLMIDIMRTAHGAYAPVSEPFGPRLETFFIGLCVAIGDIDGKPSAGSVFLNNESASISGTSAVVMLPRGVATWCSSLDHGYR